MCRISSVYREETTLNVTPVDVSVVVAYRERDTGVTEYSHVVDRDEWRKYFCDTIRTTRGVIVGYGLRSKFLHAMAYDHGTVYDPDGGPAFIYDHDRIVMSHSFIPSTAWVISGQLPNKHTKSGG